MQATAQVTPPKVVHTIPATINLQEEVKNSHKQLRVAAYCRVSTKQEDQLNSYDVQRRAYTDKINGARMDDGRHLRRQGHHRHKRQKA